MARRRGRASGRRPTRTAWWVAAGALVALYAGFRWTSGIWSDAPVPEVAPRSGLDERSGLASIPEPRPSAEVALPEASPEGEGAAPAPSATASAPGLAARAPGDGKPPARSTHEDITEEDRRALEDVLDRTVKSPSRKR